MIFVVGAARSGTSLTTRLLETCGGKLGLTSALGEHKAYKQQFIWPELKRRGYDPKGQKPIPVQPICDMDPIHTAVRLNKLICGADVVKDVKSVFFWPLLVQTYPEAHWVVVMRSLDKIAASCMRTNFMNAYGTYEEWRDWAAVYHQHCYDLLDALQGSDRGHLLRTEWFTDRNAGEAMLAGTVNACGLEWRKDTLQEVFREEIWHG